jgi:hypothetical protein
MQYCTKNEWGEAYCKALHKMILKKFISYFLSFIFIYSEFLNLKQIPGNFKLKTNLEKRKTIEQCQASNRPKALRLGQAGPSYRDVQDATLGRSPPPTRWWRRGHSRWLSRRGAERPTAWESRVRDEVTGQRGE